MTKTLDVYLHGEFVGHLIQDSGGQMIFQYAESWLETPGASPLSQSLPLRKERFSRKECRGYFGGILPEESKREIIARNLGISARNDYAMLEQIGGECAGAVTFVPAGEPRGGSGKLNSPVSGGSRPLWPKMAEERRWNEQTSPSREPQASSATNRSRRQRST
jgi:HipA-like protein